MAKYADIIEIVAPSQAAPGSAVNVFIKVKNLYSGVTGITLWCDFTKPDGANWIYIDIPASINANPGETVQFAAAFNMPEWGGLLEVWSYWWDGTGWVMDDNMTKNIALAISTPQISEFKIADFSKV